MTTPIEVHGLIFAQPEAGLPAMWGPAAWAQSQLTAGVSALAAPPPDLSVVTGGLWKGQQMRLGFTLAVSGGMVFSLWRPDFAKRK